MFVQTKPMSFDEFVAWYPDDGKRYELIEGEVVEVLPTGTHEDIAGFLVAEFNFEIRRQRLPYSIPRTCVLKPNAPRSGYQPDVIVLDRSQIPQESLWKTTSVIQNGATVPLVVEVVSTNWRDDYGHKFVEYEAMGIAEYWIVDYRALGAVRYLGTPKQPTITICQLVEGEYQLQRFTGGQPLVSSVFPELALTTKDVLNVAIA
ncbi:Uma2 family endonuclease [Baaleninema simplex]|uniref:Uma2 family endonuclease n=1 Tax=Baaleninema simplex TaxID=2862350 RepID=UPI0003474D70|nr:Uma2 family endonuclease [Baaleninema simplex]